MRSDPDPTRAIARPRAEISSRWWAFVGPVSGELLTHQGYVLIHDDPRVAQHVVPGARVADVSHGREWTAQQVANSLGRPVKLLRDHPQGHQLNREPRKEG